MQRETDFDEFSKLFEQLADIIGNDDTAKKRAGYFAALEELPMDSVRQAFQLALRQCKFFPKPVELRELVSGTRQEQGEAAWATLLKLLEEGAGQYFSAFVEDGALAAAIVRCWGSLIEAHAAMRGLAPDEPMFASQRKNFVSAYSSALNDNQSGRYFAGTNEIQNRAGVGREGQYLQPVVLASKKAVARLQMPFDGQSGELLPAAKQALLAVDRQALKAYLPAPRPQPLALVAASGEAVPMPDDVKALLARNEMGHAALRLVGSGEVAA